VGLFLYDPFESNKKLIESNAFGKKEIVESLSEFKRS
jgi:hypothetical protein